MTNTQPHALSIPVATGSPYTITIAQGLLQDRDTFAQLLGSEKTRRVAIISDETVFDLYSKAIEALVASLGHRVSIHTVPPGEATKSFAIYEGLMSALLKAEISRSDTILALGGGVVGDLAGFCAATLRRGVPFIQIPTTLLAQVDSSVGGKTAINTPFGKNLVGAFYQPKAVLIDPDTLKTLPKRELQAGFAEVIKYGLINDAEFFGFLKDEAQKLLTLDPQFLTRIIAHSCRAKATIVARDEKETGERALLNLGHTFGHAVEAVAGYDGRILHGEAVALGCLMALDASARLGLTNQDDAKQLTALYSQVDMKCSLQDFNISTTADDLLTAMAQDKKVLDSKMTFILGGIGTAAIHREVDLSIIRTLLEDWVTTA